MSWGRYEIMVCIILASAWTWLVRPRKASVVIVSGAEFDAGEGNPGSVIILQKWLGVGTAVVVSSVCREWSGSVRCSVPKSPNRRSGDMGPPSSAKMLGEYLLGRMGDDPELGLGGRLLEWWSPGREEIPRLGPAANSCTKAGSGDFIVSVVDHSYLVTLLLLWPTMLSYPSTTLVVPVVRRDGRDGRGGIQLPKCLPAEGIFHVVAFLQRLELHLAEADARTGRAVATREVNWFHSEGSSNTLIRNARQCHCRRLVLAGAPITVELVDHHRYLDLPNLYVRESYGLNRAGAAL
ncbi:hypothetical protein B296_00058829 [Ensete ventricosum]|uniref:Uncharacterized protein n=1 Tax=Ensete ventricosum TaxID=4639 RepID=A0A426XCM5_ENSVE|nr:hypothetical protein B296_00058829 [Ensete ventricosum]